MVIEPHHIMILFSTFKKYFLVFRRIRALKRLYPLSTIARDIVLLPFDILFRRGGTSRINNLIIVLTNRCNARCSVCFLDAKLNVEPDKLTFDAVSGLIDEVKRFKPCIILTGGEPLLHRDIKEIVSYIKGSGLPLMIFTNGILLDRFIDTIVRSKVDYVGVSLFGPRDVHNRITRTEFFDRVVANIRALVARKADTEVIINYTITEDNADYLRFPIDLAGDIGCDGVRYQHLSYFTAAEMEALPKSDFYDRHSVYVADRNPGAKILESLRNLRIPKGMRAQFVPTLSARELEHWYSDAPGRAIRRPCLYLSRGGHVHASGDVYPCYKINYPLGNILREPLRAILDGEKYRRFRLLFRRKGMLPICRRCCKL